MNDSKQFVVLVVNLPIQPHPSGTHKILALVPVVSRTPIVLALVPMVIALVPVVIALVPSTAMASLTPMALLLPLCAAMALLLPLCIPPII